MEGCRRPRLWRVAQGRRLASHATPLPRFRTGPRHRPVPRSPRGLARFRAGPRRAVHRPGQG